MPEYLIPAETTYFEQMIKRSRFLAWIKHADNPDHAKEYIKQIAQEYPDARHVCWAYIAGPPDTALQSMSDAGEPSGTAGKPMLNVLQHSGVGEIIAVVVRYFGGIKLGTGGLVRAYSSSVSEALKLTPLIPKIPMDVVFISCKYPEEKQVRYLVNQAQGKILDADYSNNVLVKCSIPASSMESFSQCLPIGIRLKKP
jgi:uncharacterized YigZ family protein